MCKSCWLLAQVLSLGRFPCLFCILPQWCIFDFEPLPTIAKLLPHCVILFLACFHILAIPPACLIQTQVCFQYKVICPFCLIILSRQGSLERNPLSGFMHVVANGCLVLASPSLSLSASLSGDCAPLT